MCCDLAIFILFATKFLRMFSYGSLAPIFYNYLLALGIDVTQAGILMTGILFGDLLITLNLTTRADAFGRKYVLLIGALLKFGAGCAFALTDNFWILMIAGIIGVISTSGGEIGPFVSVEQASVTDTLIHRHGEKVAKEKIPIVFGYYNAMGYLAQALGALVAGNGVKFLIDSYHFSEKDAMRSVVYMYAGIGILMALMYLTLGKEIESTKEEDQEPLQCSLSLLVPKLNVGLRRKESKFIVARLSLLFALDAFAGAFVMQTWIALWFSQRWIFNSDYLGDLISVSNVVAGISGISASYFVNRFGAINTMVWTHLPSNILLLLVPFMPTSTSAAGMLVGRFCISQMDVPARQSYVAMVVASDERSAAGGITNVARSIGMLIAPSITGYLSADPTNLALFSSPWYIAGALKCIYDLTLWALYHLSSGLKTAEASIEKKEPAMKEPLLSSVVATNDDSTDKKN